MDAIEFFKSEEFKGYNLGIYPTSFYIYPSRLELDKSVYLKHYAATGLICFKL